MVFSFGFVKDELFMRGDVKTQSEKDLKTYESKTNPNRDKYSIRIEVLRKLIETCRISGRSLTRANGPDQKMGQWAKQVKLVQLVVACSYGFAFSLVNFQRLPPYFHDL